MARYRDKIIDLREPHDIPVDQGGKDYTFQICVTSTFPSIPISIRLDGNANRDAQRNITPAQALAIAEELILAARCVQERNGVWDDE
jgi:hypothetical protein